MAKKESNKDKKKKDKPKVNPDLKGFDIQIDSFGEIQTNYNIDKINEFLNKNVEDKKLIDRDDFDKLKKSDEEE
ncbi:hypothetical protein LVD15_05350 [Fulvivirga maritima]|uniref:hypothetical protein n=1 Tax=Fulvivirga maritima TaxID=2904247 RepID=UPI001F27C04A|nr:hypothetical protein [Fulvivirga maritima]UII27850.1 hypothetical protein LVD15_05350 [Fulvivirga maritima]